MSSLYHRYRRWTSDSLSFPDLLNSLTQRASTSLSSFTTVASRASTFSAEAISSSAAELLGDAPLAKQSALVPLAGPSRPKTRIEPRWPDTRAGSLGRVTLSNRALPELLSFPVGTVPLAGPLLAVPLVTVRLLAGTTGPGMQDGTSGLGTLSEPALPAL